MSDPIFENDFVAVKECKHGYFAYNRFDAVVGGSLHLYGEWCDKELELLDEWISPGDVILDIGAYIGTHTVFFAKKVTTSGFVLAFEPQRLSFQLLCANVSLNALTNVRCFPEAVSDQVGNLQVPVIDPYAGINFGALSIENRADGEKVPVITIDHLELNKCDLIKVDVEGMEAKVLKGGTKTIEKFRPILFVENNRKEKSPEILQILHELNYSCWWHYAPYYNPDNFFQSEDNIFSHFDREDEHNVICFPKEKNIEMKDLNLCDN